MTGPKRVVRRNRGDDVNPTHPKATPTADDVAAPGGVSKQRTAGSTVSGWRRDPSDEPEPVVESGPTADASSGFDDLMAIANMDASAFEAAMSGVSIDKNLEVGSRVIGTIARITGHDAYVEVGVKAEALLDANEVPNAIVGDEIEVYVVYQGGNSLHVSTRLSGIAAEQRIAEAAETGEALAGTVTGRNKGGFDVKIGTVRAFCPASHIDRLPTRDPDTWIGEELEFRVIEADDRIVVSRKALQEDGLEDRITRFWNESTIGQVVTGIVVSVQAWGAFIDLDGVQGLLPRRTFSWTEIEDLTAVLQPGQRIESRIAKLNPDDGRIELTGRDPDQDPWGSTINRFSEQQVVPGRVVSCTDFGAFVEIAPGLQGLVHTSRYTGEAPEPGQSMEVRVLGIDVERKRIELAPPDFDGDAKIEAPDAGQEVHGVVKKVTGAGVAVDLDEGSAIRRAWLPASEVDLPAGTVLAQRFRKGHRITARVIRYEPDRGNVVLSTRADQAGEERAWRSHLRDQEKKSGGMGTFADLLGKFKA